MGKLKNQKTASKGFALLVVLSTLAILTLLFAIASRLSLANLRDQNTEVILAERQARAPNLLRVATSHLTEHPDDRAFDVSVGTDAYQIHIVDAGGLIDLNTASPHLLDTYFRALGLSADGIERFRDWRQGSHRLMRVEDFIRISGESVNRHRLSETATIYSGRSGVATEEMPETLRQLLAGGIEPAWETASSGVNFHVYRQEGAGRNLLGVLHMRPDGVVKLLWVP